MTNFDIIRNDRRLLYEYIRGSHLYGLNNELSDVDTSGVYYARGMNSSGAVAISRRCRTLVMTIRGLRLASL